MGGPQHGWRENRGAADLYHQDVTINIGENQEQTLNQPAPKERPIWMTESTVDGAVIESIPSGSGAAPVAMEKEGKAGGSKSHESEIMRALLAHERKTSGRPSYQQEPDSDNESDASASDDEFSMPSANQVNQHLSESSLAFGTAMGDGMMMTSHHDDDEEEEEEMLVMVGGRPVALDDITPDLIAQMNPVEKEEYIRLAQQAYSEMYE